MTYAPAPSTTPDLFETTTTLPPLPTIEAGEIIEVSFDWDSIQGNQLTTPEYAMTINNVTTIKSDREETALVFDGITSSAEIKPTKNNCFANIEKCKENGMTVKCRMKISKLVENSYFFSSGGEHEEFYGFAMYYKYGKMQYVVSTTTAVWVLESSAVEVNNWFNMSISWHEVYGFEIYMNEVVVASTKSSVTRREVVLESVRNILIAQSTVTEVSTVHGSFVLEEFVVLEACMSVLISSGKIGIPR